MLHIVIDVTSHQLLNNSTYLSYLLQSTLLTHSLLICHSTGLGKDSRMLDKDTMLYVGRQVQLRASEERYADSEAEAEHARLAALRRAEDSDEDFAH